jgi:hypothetical protein
VLFNGAIDLLLRGMIWFHWPSSSAWAIGTLLVVKLLVTGTTRLIVGSAEAHEFGFGSDIAIILVDVTLASPRIEQELVR